MTEQDPDKDTQATSREFYPDESDEPTIVWVRPPRRLRGFTARVHFLTELAEKAAEHGDD